MPAPWYRYNYRSSLPAIVWTPREKFWHWIARRL